MASASGHINIDDFDANLSAFGQQIAEVIGRPEKNVENRAFQEKAANSALYASIFSSQGNLISQEPSNNPVVGHTSFLWGYDPTFGFYFLDPALSQLSYYQLLYGLASQINNIPFWPYPQPRFSSHLWESPSLFPAPSVTPAPCTSIIPKVRDKSIADTKRGGKTCIWDESQRVKGRGTISRALSQSMTPAPEASSAPERKISEGGTGGQGELKIDGMGKRPQKKLELGI